VSKLPEKVVCRMQELYCAVDPATLKPAYWPTEIVRILAAEFDVEIATNSVYNNAKRHGWDHQREEAKKRIEERLPSPQVAAAVVELEERTEVLAFVRKHLKLVAQVSERAAYALGHMLDRHLACWKKLEDARRGNLKASARELAEWRAGLVSPNLLVRVLGLGGTLANNNLMQVFIGQLNAKVEETRNYFAWVGEENLPAVPEPTTDEDGLPRPAATVRPEEADLDEPPEP
jgi:hypothetical protein